MTETPIEKRHWNSLYLLLATSTIFMTLVVGIQPLFLSEIIGVSGPGIGSINAGVQVAAETLGLFLIGYLGYMSDRISRTPIIFAGFLVAAGAALLAPFSLGLGLAFGIGGLGFYFLTRVVMFLGISAVWPQLITLAGDYTNFDNRARLIAKSLFMMTLGGAVIYSILMQIPKSGGIYLVMALPAVFAFAGAFIAKNNLREIAPRLEVAKFPWERFRELIAEEPRMKLSFVSSFFARSDMVLVGMFLMLWFIGFAELAGVERKVAAARAGGLLGLVGIVILVSMPLWGIFIERFGRVSAIAGGMAFSGAGFFMFGLMDNPFTLLIIAPTILIAFGQAGCLIAPQVLAIDLTPKDLRGTVLGAFNLVGGVGIIFFVQSGGILYDIVGPHAPFVLIGIGNVLVMTYALSLRPTDVGEGKPKRRKKIVFKPVVFAICLMPLIVPLLWVMDRGGVVPGSEIAGLPLGYWNRYLGDWALNFLLVSLALRPMRELSGAAYLARYNRMTGLFAFFYTVLHVLTYVWLEWALAWGKMWPDIMTRYFIIFGIIALVMLILMALTSTKKWTQRLGPQTWKRLHRSVYAVNLLVAVHFILATITADAGIIRALIYTVLILLLLGYRVRQSLRARAPAPKAASKPASGPDKIDGIPAELVNAR